MGRRRNVTAAVAVPLIVLALVLALTLTVTPHGTFGLTGSWRNADGDVLPDGGVDDRGALAIRTYPGAAHCDEDSVVFLELTWPPANIVDSNDSDAMEQFVRTFARDPGNVVRATASSPFEVVDAMPPASVDTGIHRWGNKLAIDPAGDAYITRVDSSIERWPRLTELRGCD